MRNEHRTSEIKKGVYSTLEWLFLYARGLYPNNDGDKLFVMSINKIPIHQGSRSAYEGRANFAPSNIHSAAVTYSSSAYSDFDPRRALPQPIAEYKNYMKKK